MLTDSRSLPYDPSALRALIRKGQWTGPTAGLASGRVQANVVVLPQEQAFDFLLFCQRNPKPCPLLEVLEPGRTEAALSARGSDIRTDVPRYRVYRSGVLTGEREDLREIWRPDLVTFLIGCSFSFEAALLVAGIPLRHIDQGKNVSMYVTSISTVPVGQFAGPIVVSMRPIPQSMVVRAVQVTSRYPGVHGAPLHIGSPQAIGIHDLARPDYGDPIEVKEGETPVFWACGVTPQAVAVQSKPPLMITHSPGHMFITDLRDEDMAVI
ncbi:MAG: putative hydro-lyase [Chloroflexi bacterium]|nr:putative hydro-lyase [Chloroflexota bacterium]